MKEAKLDSSFKIVAAILLTIICFTVGIILTVKGVRETKEQNEIIKSYKSTEGYFVDYNEHKHEEYDRNSVGRKETTMYSLIYRYTVDGKEYTIETDYETSLLPEENSTKEIKYNPENPEEAIIEGINSHNSLIFFGIFFMIIPVMIFLGILSKIGVFNKFKIDFFGFLAGIVFLIIGVGFIFYNFLMTGSFSGVLKNLGLWIIIPNLFIIVGIYLIIYSLFFKLKR